MLWLLFISTLAFAEELPVKLGGFLDTYYAFDPNRPKSHEREFTTQPVRDNEFNINLAYIDAVLKQEKTRGRLALQFGQSVTKNTVGEPKDGATSGAQDAKIFQEAFLGRKLSEKTWIDMGIFLGNIGAESWVSKDNWTYTRALNLDYVPYYSAGVRLEQTLHKKQSFQIFHRNRLLRYNRARCSFEECVGESGMVYSLHSLSGRNRPGQAGSIDQFPNGGDGIDRNGAGKCFSFR